jgi:hypothetical protein
MKLDLLTNATVVDDAMRFVSQKSRDKTSYISNEDDKELNEPDYDEDQLEEENGEITTAVTNQVF